MTNNGLYLDLEAASRDFWAGHTGRELPPAPTYRMVPTRFGGETKKFGRYVDPYICHAHMRRAQVEWRNFCVPFWTWVVVSVVVADLDAWLLLLMAPVLAVIYFTKRYPWKRLYDHYEQILYDIDAAGGNPVWVAFNGDRLAELRGRPEAIGRWG